MLVFLGVVLVQIFRNTHQFPWTYPNLVGVTCGGGGGRGGMQGRGRERNIYSGGAQENKTIQELMIVDTSAS